MHAKSAPGAPQRVLARARGDQVLAERLEDRLERDQVLVDVVDEQEVHRPGTTAPRGASRCEQPIEEAADLLERQHRVGGADRGERCPGHLVPLAEAGSWITATPPSSFTPRAPRRRPRSRR